MRRQRWELRCCKSESLAPQDGKGREVWKLLLSLESTKTPGSSFQNCEQTNCVIVLSHEDDLGKLPLQSVTLVELLIHHHEPMSRV